MKRRFRFSIALILMITITFCLRGEWVLAQESGAASGGTGSTGTAVFLLLLPLGLFFLTGSTLPRTDRDAPRAATLALAGWALAGLIYFLCGFAFQFGGLAINNSHPDFSELYWNWSPLDASFGTGWGVVGLRGWALLGNAATPGIFDLFLRHLALLGVVVTVPAFILYRRLSTTAFLGFAVLSGSLLYPLVGNWVWSGGWLASLGLTLGLGHGFVDAGIVTPLLVTGAVCLAALLLPPVGPESAEIGVDEPSTEPPPTFAEVPLPAAYWPLLSFLGLALVLWSWAFLAGVDHLPTAAPITTARAALNGIMAALSAGLVAALYSLFTTRRADSLLTTRGALAGLVAASTVAPFIQPWLAIVIGLLVGLLVPLLIYLVDHGLHLPDPTAGVAIYLGIGMLAALLPGLLADGSTGAGWNNVGQAVYLGVEGQGVSGLLVAAGYVADWPGQFSAQLLGLAAIVGWPFLLSFLYFKLVRPSASPDMSAADEAAAEPAQVETPLSPSETAAEAVVIADSNPDGA